MTFIKKLRTIRKARDMTQLQLAVEMGYNASTVDNYENERNRISAKVYKAFKVATGTVDVPITDEEMLIFKNEQLNAWNHMVNFGDIEKAKELQLALAYRVKWSYDVEMQLLYDIYNINYYSRIDKKEESDKMVASLKEREAEFTEEHWYWYYRYLGSLEHWNWKYKAAMALYMKAEEIGNRIGLNDNAIYYNIGNCLTHMGYSYLAMLYLEKIQLKELNVINMGLWFTIQSLLAINYSKLGRTDEALELLESSLEYCLKEKSSDRLSSVYFSLGWVHKNSGNFEKALENYDLASSCYIDKGEMYLSCLCHKVLLLRANNKNDEATKYINEGLYIATKGSLWYEWLQAIRYSLMLDEKGAIGYLEFTSIPKLREYGMHEIVMSCYEWIDKYYLDIGKYKYAHKYAQKAAMIYKKLMEGDMSI